MSDERIHRAHSDDGTEIVGTVHGEGPPLVLVHGVLDDGEVHWFPILPFLTDQFTCYVMSTRNRGRCGTSEDLSPERHVQDVAAFAASIGEPVGLVGLSLGGTLALGAAARLDALTGVAAYEPAIYELLAEEDFVEFVETIGTMGEYASQGGLAEAARRFYELVGNDEEVSTFADMGAFEITGRNVPVDLEMIQQGTQYQGPRGTEASVLAGITAPVLLFHGARSRMRTWFLDGVRHVAEHVRDTEVRELSDAGHLGPVTDPELVADELISFFSSVRQPE